MPAAFLSAASAAAFLSLAALALRAPAMSSANPEVPKSPASPLAPDLEPAAAFPLPTPNQLAKAKALSLRTPGA